MQHPEPIIVDPPMEYPLYRVPLHDQQLLTAKSTDSDKAEGLDVGADAYIVKPFNIDLLIKQSLNLIENRNRIEIKPLDDKVIQEMLSPEPIPSADEQLLEKVG